MTTACPNCGGTETYKGSCLVCGSSSTGSPPGPGRRVMAFTAEELETLRVALLSAHYSAMDEERALSGQLQHVDPDRQASVQARLEDARAEAARRAHAYHLLVERVMAASTM